jgi:hypothetical protein
MVEVKIDDPSADRYPFTFKIGDLVAEGVGGSIDAETKGEIVDRKYEGDGHWYSTTYTIKRLEDEFYYQAKELDLKKVD